MVGAWNLLQSLREVAKYLQIATIISSRGHCRTIPMQFSTNTLYMRDRNHLAAAAIVGVAYAPDCCSIHVWTVARSSTDESSFFVFTAFLVKKKKIDVADVHTRSQHLSMWRSCKLLNCYFSGRWIECIAAATIATSISIPCQTVQPNNNNSLPWPQQMQPKTHPAA